MVAERESLSADPPELTSIEEAIAAVGAGRMIILVDDEDRENEGDLVIAADAVRPADIAFMSQHGRGLICLALDAEIVERLRLPPMTETNLAPLGTAFTVSVDAASITGSGLSAEGRARTARAAVEPESRPSDLVSPGHLFPLRARPGGSLVRSGQTEGSVDLARLAGREPAALICEVMKGDGTMARLPELLELGREHDIGVSTVADLIAYRLRHELLVSEVAESSLPSRFGDFRIRVFRSAVDEQDHVVLQLGEILTDEPTLVRVHRADLIADTFGRFHDDGPGTLHRALDQIRTHGRGVVLYLEHQDRRWPGMVPPSDGSRAAPFRAFGIGAQILRSLGLQRIRVITSNPRAFKGLKGFGLEIEDFVSLAGE